MTCGCWLVCNCGPVAAPSLVADLPGLPLALAPRPPATWYPESDVRHPDHEAFVRSRGGSS